MSDLPTGWTMTTLGALGRYINGRGFKKSEWGANGRPIIRIQNLTGSSQSFNFYDGPVDERNLARQGDLLVSWAATLGAYIWNGPDALVNQHIFKVESYIDKGFHKYLLDYHLDELMSHTHGSGMVHITRPQFDGLLVAIPSMEEQRRIVDLLESHLSQLDAAGGSLTSAAKSLSAWEAVSTEAVLRANASRCAPLEDLLLEPLRNGHSAPRVTGSGVRTLTLTAVTQGDFSNANTKITSADKHRVRDLWLKRDDILVQRANTAELVGTSAIFDGPSDWAIFPDLLIRVRVDPRRSLPAYVAAVLAGRQARDSLRAQAKGLAGSMPKIDQRAIAHLSIPVPPLNRQQDIVSRLEELRLTAARQKAEITRLRSRAELLGRSLLTAACSGQLTSGVIRMEQSQ